MTVCAQLPSYGSGGRCLPERVATGLPWAVTHTVHPVKR
jgi:hypothetical protein